MRRFMPYILLVAALILCACERRDLYDEAYDENNVELIIDIDLEVVNDSEVNAPNTLAALFSNQETGEFLQHEYTGPKGGKVNILPGTYDLLVYNFDTSSTHVREDHHMHTIEAYTNEVQGTQRTDYELTKKYIKQHSRGDNDYFNQPIVYEPDHLFTARLDNIDIPHVTSGSYRKVINVQATTIVKVYKLRILNVKGIENISEAAIYLTGQVQSVQFGTGEITGVPTTIYFEVERSSNNELRNTFRTFGKYPGVDSKVYMIVDIIDNGGKRHIWEWDVTDQFAENNDEIVIDEGIDIPDPSNNMGGGFEPTVNLWEDHMSEISI